MLVPKSLLQTIDDVETFKQQIENYRVSRNNIAIINLTTLKRYSTIDNAAVDVNTTVSKLKTCILEKRPLNGEEWIYEKNIPFDQYQLIKDKLKNLTLSNTSL